MEIRTITSFLENEVREYAKDVIENRAIPSVIDGLKPTARKVVYIANKKWKTLSEKPMKVFQLTGAVAEQAYYHHGDASLNSTIVNMAQRFKNNMPLLEDIGQYGTLRSPYAGAPRYISTRLSSNFRLIYKDFDLLENQVDEGNVIEPKYFLPIIPACIVNGSSGIAVAFAINVLNRNPFDVIDACKAVITGKKINENNLKPYYSDFSGRIEQDLDNNLKWHFFGKYEIIKEKAVHITELPPNIQYEAYEAYLNTLIDKKIIVDYDDNCSNNIDYTVYFKKEILKDYIAKGKLDGLLKMESTETENFTFLDEESNIKQFSSVIDIVKYFVDFRLVVYSKRKTKLIADKKHIIQVLNNKIRFIENIGKDNSILLDKRENALIEYLESNKFDKIDESYYYLTSMSISSFTQTNLNKLKNQLVEEENELKVIEEKNEKEMYLEDLKELKKSIK